MLINVGKVRLLEFIKAGIAAVDAEVRLLKTNIVPAAGDDWTDYSAHEADFSGYAAENCTTWGTPTLVGSAAVVEADEITFAHDGGGTDNTIYVRVLVDNDDDTVIDATRLATPVVMDGLGKEITLTPTLRIGNASSSGGISGIDGGGG